MTEAEVRWLTELRNGKESATEELVDSYASQLRGYIRAIVKNTQDTEDILQDVFLHFLKGLPSFRGDCSIKSYLFRIAHNLSVNHVSSAASRYETQPEENFTVTAGQNSPQKALQSVENADRVVTAVAKLPPRQRSVMVLRAWQDFTFREIAAILSLKEGTVKANYFFGIRSLRKLLEVEDEP